MNELIKGINVRSLMQCARDFRTLLSMTERLKRKAISIMFVNQLHVRRIPIRTQVIVASWLLILV